LDEVKSVKGEKGKRRGRKDIEEGNLEQRREQKKNHSCT
jgi:hypothetical protein